MTALTDRMLADVKQSPAKALVLGVGLLAAVVVWGPRLTASLAQPAPGSVDGATLVTPSDMLRDPESIRSAFIRVSDEAKLLRRYADAQDPGAVAHDPFEHEEVRTVEVAPPPVVEPDTTAATAEREAIASEAESARALRLNGVVIFKGGRGAVIEGEIVRIGGRVGPFTLTDVAERTATVRGDHGTYSLVMTTEEKEP